MKLKKGPTIRINGTMDEVIYERMKSMMVEDRIWEFKEFIEKLVREEWERRGLNSVPSSSVDRLMVEAVQAGKRSPSTGLPKAPPSPSPTRRAKNA